MKNFFDCKDEKITEKAFSQSLIISVVSILLCLVALCSMTFAWFTEGVSSGGNTLVSGTFGLHKPIVKTTVGETAIEVTGENGVYSCTLPANGTYLVTLTCGDSTAKGHCVVTINGGEEQHTAAIIGTNTANVENKEITDPFKFKITITKETTVVLEPRWGVVVNADIDYNEEIKVGTVPSGEESNEGTE